MFCFLSDILPLKIYQKGFFISFSFLIENEMNECSEIVV